MAAFTVINCQSSLNISLLLIKRQGKCNCFILTLFNCNRRFVENFFLFKFQNEFHLKLDLDKDFFPTLRRLDGRDYINFLTKNTSVWSPSKKDIFKAILQTIIFYFKNVMALEK